MQLAVRARNLLLLLLFSLSACESKVIRGTVSSKEAWEQKGQFVTKFCFRGKLVDTCLYLYVYPYTPLYLNTDTSGRNLTA